MKVKKSYKGEYVRLSLSALKGALEKTYKISIAPYSYGDELHVFEGIKAQKKLGKYTPLDFKFDKEAVYDFFAPYEDARTISSYDVDTLLTVAVSCGLLEGRNFIVDMQH